MDDIWVWRPPELATLWPSMQSHHLFQTFPKSIVAVNWLSITWSCPISQSLTGYTLQSTVDASVLAFSLMWQPWAIGITIPFQELLSLWAFVMPDSLGFYPISTATSSSPPFLAPLPAVPIYVSECPKYLNEQINKHIDTSNLEPKGMTLLVQVSGSRGASLLEMGSPTNL